jgi:hypothetical protein
MRGVGWPRAVRTLCAARRALAARVARGESVILKVPIFI